MPRTATGPTKSSKVHGRQQSKECFLHDPDIVIIDDEDAGARSKWFVVRGYRGFASLWHDLCNQNASAGEGRLKQIQPVSMKPNHSSTDRGSESRGRHLALTLGILAAAGFLPLTGCTTVLEDDVDEVDSVSRTVTETTTTPFGDTMTERRQTTTITD